MIGSVDAGALGDRHRRHLDVDALRDADLPRRAALDPRLHLRGGRGRPRLAMAPVLDASPCPMVLPFMMLAVLFRGIENFKMFDLVNLLTGGGPGSTTEVASITLKREAFEKWRTGYASAFAIILFVTVFGLANIYVKALNRVKRDDLTAAYSVTEPSPRQKCDRRHRWSIALRADHDGAAALDHRDRLQDAVRTRSPIRRRCCSSRRSRATATSSRRAPAPDAGVHRRHAARRRPGTTQIVRQERHGDRRPVALWRALPQLGDHRLRLDLPRRSFSARWRPMPSRRFKVPLKDDLLFFILSTRMMPPIAVAIPIFLMYRAARPQPTRISA